MAVALTRARDALVEPSFFAYAVITGLFLGAFDWFYLTGVEPLVFATVILGEATAMLAAASYYNGYQQKVTNERLEGIVSRWLEIEGTKQPFEEPPDE
jgi:hypothetical protein